MGSVSWIAPCTPSGWPLDVWFLFPLGKTLKQWAQVRTQWLASVSGVQHQLLSQHGGTPLGKQGQGCSKKGPPFLDSTPGMRSENVG